MHNLWLFMESKTQSDESMPVLTFSVMELVRRGWYGHPVVVGGKDGSLAVFPDPVGCAIAVWFIVVAGESRCLGCLLILQAWRGRYTVREVDTVFWVAGAIFQAVCAHDWPIIAWNKRN